MKYRTQSGNLMPKEMSDEHLVNRLKFEIDKLQTAKIVINGESDELTPFQAILHAQNNSMTISRAQDVVEGIEDRVAPLMLEMLFRNKPGDVYVKTLSDLLEKNTFKIAKDSLFLSDNT